VTFHNKLGSQQERITRIAALAREIAPSVGADADLAEQAAQVAKADLSSEMVYEFPELQGVMGRYYAQAAGLPTEVAVAAQEHYSPLGPSDDVPSAPVSVAVSLADKIDTLTGFWAIDEKPTGSKDPFALRRAALGVIRLVVENGITISLSDLVRDAAFTLAFRQSIKGSQAYSTFEEGGLSSTGHAAQFARYKGGDFDASLTAKDIEIGEHFEDRISDYYFYSILDELRRLDPSTDLLSFIHDRLKVFLRDRGIRHDIIDACIAMPNDDDLTLLVKRAEALSETLKTEDGANLIQGFKRANNILSQAEEKDGVSYELDPNVKFAENDAEKALFNALDEAAKVITPAMEAEDFASAMSAMAKLRAPIDAFFEDTKINTDNDIIRRNRMCLLHRIRTICGGVADLTKLES
jgi:glycyl-tRNA synthetase beta chain